MSSKKINLTRFHFLAALCLSMGYFLATILSVSAAELSTRSIQLSSSFAGELVSHRFEFNTVGVSTIGSISFLYCTNSPLHEDPCIAPNGLDTDNFIITTQSGINGFTSSVATTANHIVLTRPSSAQPAGNAVYTFANITNPTTADDIVFVRISVYDAADATGTRVDRGSVVFVVEDRYDISAYVPPYLIFCTGVSVALDCSNTTGYVVNFGEFNSNAAVAVTTQMSAATNDLTGYNTFVSGQTMTSGNNIIPPLAVQSASNPGTSQFGINLRSNSSPVIGSDPESGPVGSGAPDNLYNVANQYRFVNGEKIAGSNQSTGFSRYTVSYIVNISSDQAPGVYATTMTYTAVASF